MNQRNAEKLKYELLETWNTFNHYMTEALTFHNTEDVHQARVHLRKLLTFMQLYDTKPSTYRQLKQLMEALGAVRDGDVLLQGLAIETGLEQAFADHMEANRAKDRTILNSRVTEKMTPSLDQQVRRFIGGQLYRSLKKQDASAFLDKAKSERKRRVESHHHATSKHDRLETLHKVRLAVKRERYLHEYLLNYEEKASKDQVQKLKRLQTELGEMNDRHQLLLRWTDFSPPTEYVSAYERLIDTLHEQLDASVDAIKL
ncbi:CHAD domain-containing protein [Exiguobacterium sp. SH31]|uniref:CHAD domain-containing protein n=1 Tax=unclassified Exiguobacterium TaxID=2644629 RepID=UPI0008B494BD|nr:MULTISPECIES: CHAD domain-containing protein [unclassified Exiguobacterium]OGX78656.1 CHAD domain-containing protein [Exiguobacterium sp. SH31]TCI67098.1 CHAD domain-containing protein [Exiguobacterium sp. SH0S7]